MLNIVLLILEILVLYFLSRRVVSAVYKLFYKVTKRKSWTMYLFAIVFWPGTFIHEMSHFLAALFLLVPVGKLELIPKEKEDATGPEGHRLGGAGFKLGSVAIAKTDPLRRFLIGVAPLIFGLGIIFVLIYFVSMNQFIDTWWGYVIVGVIIFQIANSMFASKKDLEGAIVILVLFILILLIIILLGVDVVEIFINHKFDSKVLELLKMTNIFLLVPIIIDSMALLVLRKK